MIARTTRDTFGVPMKHFLPLILTLATGCSTMQSNQAAPHHLYPPEEFQQTPAVDRQVINHARNICLDAGAFSDRCAGPEA